MDSLSEQERVFLHNNRPFCEDFDDLIKRYFGDIPPEDIGDFLRNIIALKKNSEFIQSLCAVISCPNCTGKQNFGQRFLEMNENIEKLKNFCDDFNDIIKDVFSNDSFENIGKFINDVFALEKNIETIISVRNEVFSPNGTGEQNLVKKLLEITEKFQKLEKRVKKQ